MCDSSVPLQHDDAKACSPKRDTPGRRSPGSQNTSAHGREQGAVHTSMNLGFCARVAQLTLRSAKKTSIRDASMSQKGDAALGHGPTMLLRYRCATWKRATLAVDMPTASAEKKIAGAACHPKRQKWGTTIPCLFLGARLWKAFSHSGSSTT